MSLSVVEKLTAPFPKMAQNDNILTLTYSIFKLWTYKIFEQ